MKCFSSMFYFLLGVIAVLFVFKEARAQQVAEHAGAKFCFLVETNRVVICGQASVQANWQTTTNPAKQL